MEGCPPSAVSLDCSSTDDDESSNLLLDSSTQIMDIILILVSDLDFRITPDDHLLPFVGWDPHVLRTLARAVCHTRDPGADTSRHSFPSIARVPVTSSIARVSD